MGKQPKVTQAKRNREQSLRVKRQEKEARRVQRKQENAERPPVLEGEDPDLVGLKPGPQPPLF